MSQPFRNAANSFNAAETSIRQLIANGKTKTALENAKEAHKQHATAASEGLLIDAYIARIHGLEEQSLKLEADSLRDLVCSRFPSARGRIQADTSPGAAMAQLLAPLADPELLAEKRTAIENRVQLEVWNVADVATCQALPETHPLRQAAAALLKAFVAVTTTPITEDELALPEVSRRSPLAPWKMLVRAIGYVYRREDGRARECLDAIPPKSGPARLIPALRAVLGERPAAPLSPAAALLVSQITANSQGLHSALEKLDRALEAGTDDKQILQAAKAAVRECSLHAPARLERVKQHISVRCAMSDLGRDRVMAAIGGGLRQDAYFYRLFARGMELMHDPDNLVFACSLWEEFRQAAVREGWFSRSGAEAATLYLHMAGVIRRVPGEVLARMRAAARADRKNSEELSYFLSPNTLYERACTLDPHFEAFSQWMEWAKAQKNGAADRVATAWHTIRPTDIDPILYLMHDFAARNAFPTALKYLNKAEQIDAVHPAVRRARLQLLAGSTIKYIQQRKPHLAEQRLAEIVALPQAQQGDRPAFIAALRYLTSKVREDFQTAATHRAEVERLLGGKGGAALLIFGVATAAKRGAYEIPEQCDKLSKDERAGLPAATARVTALAADMNAMKLQIPWRYIDEAASQLSRQSGSLDIHQLQILAEAGICSNHEQLGYTATAAGLERGGPSDARFLLLRAKLLPMTHADRQGVCAAAAAELGRQQRDMRLVEEAVELTRVAFGPRALTLTLEQAGEVLRKEKAAKHRPKYPGDGPNYRDLLPKSLCPCPVCRAERGELIDDDEEDFDDEFDGPFADSDDAEDFQEELEKLFASMDIPPEISPEIARMLFEETKKAALRGETLEDLQERVFETIMGGRKGKKGRRR